MDKNKDNTFDVPAADIQDKITLLMGLPPEEAAARLDKQTPPRRVVGSNPTVSIQKSTESVVDNTPEPVAQKAAIIDVNTDDAAVDEIIADEKNTQQTDTDSDKDDDYLISQRPKKGIRRLLSNWWHNKLFRNMTLLIILAGIVLAIALPVSRYAILNAIGVRSALSVQIVDAVSGRPIKNVTVTIDEVTTKTDDKGQAQLEGLRLGDAAISLQKRSFKEEVVPVTVGWGSNPFDAPIELIPTGTTFTFKITDWLSATPLQNVEVSDGESIAVSDASGVAKLTLEPTDADIEITTKYDGYRSETTTIPVDTLEDQQIALVPSKRDIFISKRNGVYDIYSRYVDGSEEVVLLPGTGSEQIDTHILNHPTQPITAIVSSRAANRSANGTMLSDIYLVNTDSKQVEKIENTSSERLRLIGWAGDTLLYVSSSVGVAASDNRHKVIAYNSATKSSTEIASANYFSDVRLINDSVYYVIPSSDGSQSGGLTKTAITGKDKSILLAKTIWSVHRSSVDTLQVSTDGDEWYEINLAQNKVTKLDGAPAIVQNRLYIKNASTGASAWLEDRDGKSALIVVDKETNNQKEVIKQAGMVYPLQWLNTTTLLYSISNSQETANYVVSTLNGKSKRIGDVTVSVYGDNQYYY